MWGHHMADRHTPYSLDTITDNLLNPFSLKAFALNKLRFAGSRLFVNIESVNIPVTRISCSFKHV